ncbi:MAG TPA: hypothetical protein VGT41_02230 [Candidatus Babeliales bacterium]|nr:hypothetical protein [Candidatus Babeliales bacterium]
MNFKNMALMLLLLPVASFGNKIQKRFEELRNAQVAKSQEVLEASNLVAQRAEIYLTKRKAVLKFWESKKEGLLDPFLIEFTRAFYCGGDIDVLIEKSPVNKEDIEALKFALMGTAAAIFLYTEAVFQYRTRVTELTTINIELNRLEE